MGGVDFIRKFVVGFEADSIRPPTIISFELSFRFRQNKLLLSFTPHSGPDARRAVAFSYVYNAQAHYAFTCRKTKLPYHENKNY